MFPGFEPMKECQVLEKWQLQKVRLTEILRLSDLGLEKSLFVTCLSRITVPEVSPM